MTFSPFALGTHEQGFKVKGNCSQRLHGDQNQKTMETKTKKKVQTFAFCIKINSKVQFYHQFAAPKKYLIISEQFPN